MVSPILPVTKAASLTALLAANLRAVRADAADLAKTHAVHGLYRDETIGRLAQAKILEELLAVVTGPAQPSSRKRAGRKLNPRGR